MMGRVVVVLCVMLLRLQCCPQRQLLFYLLLIKHELQVYSKGISTKLSIFLSKQTIPKTALYWNNDRQQEDFQYPEYRIGCSYFITAEHNTHYVAIQCEQFLPSNVHHQATTREAKEEKFHSRYQDSFRLNPKNRSENSYRDDGFSLIRRTSVTSLFGLGIHLDDRSALEIVKSARRAIFGTLWHMAPAWGQ